MTQDDEPNEKAEIPNTYTALTKEWQENIRHADDTFVRLCTLMKIDPSGEVDGDGTLAEALHIAKTLRSRLKRKGG